MEYILSGLGRSWCTTLMDVYTYNKFSLWYEWWWCIALVYSMVKHIIVAYSSVKSCGSQWRCKLWWTMVDLKHNGTDFDVKRGVLIVAKDVSGVYWWSIVVVYMMVV